MLVYFDIDSTVFTTHLFKKTRIDPQLEELLGVPLEEIQQTENEYFGNLEKSTDFQYQAFASFLATTYAHVGGTAPEHVIQGLFEKPELYRDMLFSDVMPLVRELSDRGIQMGVYSEGYTDFQTNKITFTGLSDYLEPSEIVIARRKQAPEVLAKLSQPSIVIDDKVEYLETLPIEVGGVWINRKTEENHPIFATIHSLEEVLPLV
ncbi:MAG: hypothetical protein H6773_04200 [Pseudomonadales bacterium]|nr:hypothetical protein [Candidatus Woesebacteria bacterium]MCB9801361.1 hypothetical protein [Pseudomonadales bacterium]